ncbi:uncharacterized protein C8Q71DRAFT_698456 [Rhodofomes roseus]|uniref:Uncharacterized protein n=1 Tax=Rhodofomes roseus TaxID=34475 RepID=A0ABQ8KTG3_9APHY|nr:uncharacterized protein C8Q71DRAFT_698456 [Rhodofomes roseus]KAH9842375.1 hypothetical protein C8Q71DRAFT_698456 [Rhodofomes roseus]
MCTRFVLLTSLLLSQVVSAGTTNRTIDDTHGDSVTGVLPTYSNNWNYGPNCSFCAIRPDANETFDGTWHDTTSNSTDPTQPSMTLTFDGSAISVYCILVNSASSPDIVTFTNVTFELDGASAGTYNHTADPAANQFEYNVTVFSREELSNETHTLVMNTVQGSSSSVLLFDWAMYT